MGLDSLFFNTCWHCTHFLTLTYAKLVCNGEHGLNRVIKHSGDSQVLRIWGTGNPNGVSQRCTVQLYELAMYKYIIKQSFKARNTVKLSGSPLPTVLTTYRAHEVFLMGSLYCIVPISSTYFKCMAMTG